MSICAKCKQDRTWNQDTWCLACAAWESLAAELTAPWGSPACRPLATDQILNCVKAVRSLRQLSTSIQSAGASRSALDKGSAGSGRAPQVVCRSGPPGAAAKVLPPGPKESNRSTLPPPPAPVRAKDETESEYSGESGEAVDLASGERASGSRPVAEVPTPPSPPRGRVREVRDRSRRRHSGAKDRGGHKTRRAGRKHQRLHRTLDNPSIRVHQRLPGSYFDDHEEPDDGVNPADL